MKLLPLHLSLIPHIGPLTIKRVLGLLARRGKDDAWLYRATVEEVSMAGISPAQAQLLVAGLRDMRVLHEEIELIKKYAITVLFENDEAYPSWLRSIHAPPAVLYVQGSSNAWREQKNIAVVGSRRANTYGRSVVDTFVPLAVQAGWAVISGGARGIDAHAHRVAFQHGGSTVAILGSGLLRPYPPENEKLFQEMVEKGGAVVSPFPLRMSALPGNFPARNRIIAGMSRLCVVVQAAEKSGALITATYALAEGRDVGVVPGSIFDPLSAGCHKLLREGATPLVSSDEFKIFLGEEASGPAIIQCAIPLMETQALHGTDSSCVNNDPIMKACAKKACSFDELLSYAASTSDELHQRLWELQLEGKISQTVTGLWEAI